MHLTKRGTRRKAGFQRQQDVEHWIESSGENSVQTVIMLTGSGLRSDALRDGDPCRSRIETSCQNASPPPSPGYLAPLALALAATKEGLAHSLPQLPSSWLHLVPTPRHQLGHFVPPPLPPEDGSTIVTAEPGRTTADGNSNGQRFL